MPAVTAPPAVTPRAALGRAPMFNPYLSSNLYTGSSSYLGGMSRPYGQSNASRSSYGTGGSGGGSSGVSSSGYGNPSPSADHPDPYAASTTGGAAPYPPQPAPTGSTNLLDTMGVANAGGRLSWPLGLRILPSGEKAEELRRQIDGLLRQSANGPAAPRLLEATGTAVDELHGLLRQKAAYLTRYTYDEADRFLRKLANGLKLLNQGG